jgi:uncharacterized membrane protein required for colicin V production
MTGYILFLTLFIIVISTFAYLDTRQGFRAAIPKFLGVFMPMVLAGLIVKIPELIGVTKKIGVSQESDIAPYLIGGIGAIIFYTVLIKVFKKEESTRKLNILDYFVGFILGLSRGWLYFGFFALYLNKIFDLGKNSADLIKLLSIIEEPVKWVLFFSFF